MRVTFRCLFISLSFLSWGWVSVGAQDLELSMDFASRVRTELERNGIVVDDLKIGRPKKSRFHRPIGPRISGVVRVHSEEELVRAFADNDNLVIFAADLYVEDPKFTRFPVAMVDNAFNTSTKRKEVSVTSGQVIRTLSADKPSWSLFGEKQEKIDFYGIAAGNRPKSVAQFMRKSTVHAPSTIRKNALKLASTGIQWMRSYRDAAAALAKNPNGLALNLRGTGKNYGSWPGTRFLRINGFLPGEGINVQPHYYWAVRGLENPIPNKVFEHSGGTGFLFNHSIDVSGGYHLPEKTRGKVYPFREIVFAYIRRSDAFGADRTDEALKKAVNFEIQAAKFDLNLQNQVDTMRSAEQ